MEQIVLSEDSDQFRLAKKEWIETAMGCTLETLPAFLSRLTESYEHDYGTICHAVALAAVAAAQAVNHSPTGGITGFQAGAVMWGFIAEWNHSSNKTGMRLMDYDNFLFPQYASQFEKRISGGVWAAIQKEAKINIECADKELFEYSKKMLQYNDDIAAFVAKHPDYYKRKEHYDPLGIGNSDQLEEEDKKKASGFEFAPQEPCRPVSDTVYRHWASICEGKVPFGYAVEEE
jgi:hypothetical protein